MKIIGLTGGIGSGKTTVSNYIKEKGILVIDADELSYDLTKEGGEALPKIREIFGDKVFNLDGTLNRKALAEIVFNNQSELKKLEEITTNIVNERIKNIILDLKDSLYDGIVVLDIPLLFETGDEVLCDETWLVTCDLEERISRILKRDNISRSSILKRIDAQMPDIDKIKKATYLIDNSYGLDELYHRIDELLIKK